MRRTTQQVSEDREIARAAAEVRELELKRAAPWAINSAEVRACNLRLAKCKRELQEWTTEKERAVEAVRIAQEKLERARAELDRAQKADEGLRILLRDTMILINDYTQRLRLLSRFGGPEGKAGPGENNGAERNSAHAAGITDAGSQATAGTGSNNS